MYWIVKNVTISLLIISLIILSIPQAIAQNIAPRERICGKWENQAKTLRIQVYTENNDFKAKIIWFSDTEGKPMSYWKDKRNPDPKLRDRNILGMGILRDLKYNANKGTWENGKVYDSKHGKEWNASASIDKKDRLKVRGYWHFKWIGKSMTFHRIK
ncbi:DUF2147 domain-containing protein [Mucilaginibacter sp. UR6-1]|uniref:DUF2147 domain-containing protein n=1 Tax=Mucilaginibacter sp. UR6-1 TaxID=1435643 RepID=UPI001E64FAF3|nr:DUF2147 domain-containing protein [Mucilaginibacter sp. UR6-1]MCC8410780.1 DUF2147 domain-containing protein [Mucilaginibacter sp. UR6-1]